MKTGVFKGIMKLLLAAIVCSSTISVWADSEVYVETAGTLASLLPSSDSKLKVSGYINGTDVKYLRQLIDNGSVASLDLSEVRIVKGGEAYYETFKTADDVIGESMFHNCAKLKSILLPTTVTAIESRAFASTGIGEVDIPGNVSRLGGDAFAYCNSLQKVVIGRKVNQLGQGVFWSSDVKNAYVKPMTPPAVPAYLFGSSPKIHVYTDALTEYQNSSWKECGTITGGLEDIYPQEADPNTIAKKLCGNYFEDAACTQLKAEFQAMSDDELTTTLTEVGMPELMITTALKVKNGSWAAYEQDFRIHSYKAYSDASYWNNKMMSTGGSYMGNPTGIYAKNDGEEIYVFVDEDVPSDATLYIAGCVDNQLITSAKTGIKLTKGLNVIEGTKNALYYIVYTADTKSMTKTLNEWPNIKIHVEGGVVNGYYDLSRHSDADYKAILKAATLNRFTIRGGESLIHLKTSSFKTVFPNSIDKSITWFDSIAVWQKDLMGYTVAVATGQRAGAPFYLTGGEAIYPIYYNNPNFAIEGEPEDAGYANSTPYRTSYNGLDCIRNCLNATNPDMDDWCAGHECGHNNQGAINLEGGTEASNNLFSNFCRYHDGLVSSTGSTLATVMEEFARHEPFYTRGVDSQLRMYWDLYLYYHLGQKNTSFYPELFKALRNDRLSLWETNNNNSGLKFVRKVCEVAQEDLTDFFTIWGFFEPMRNTPIEDYGAHTLTVTKANINSTKNRIAKFEKKNREIIFVEDRADYVLTTDFLTTAGKKRRGSEQVGQCGDLGQFTDYLPGVCQPSSYTYLQADSIYHLDGTGGLGILMLDDEGGLKYASNAKNFYIPSSVDDVFKLYSMDADGSLHEIEKAGEGAETVTVERAPGGLSKLLSENVIKATIIGSINGTDIKYLRKLITEGNLVSIDLTNAKIVSGGQAYYENYTTSANVMGAYAFNGFKKLISMKLPQKLTSIGTNAFSGSGLREIVVPESVTSIGEDAFAYCDMLKRVIIGTKMKTMNKGSFYSSKVKDVYILAATPPSPGSYLFSSNPTIHVYADALAKYQAHNDWPTFGTLVGDLDQHEEVTPVEAPEADVESESTYAPVYSLKGFKVNSMQPGSIYIRNGKKIITQP